MKLIPLLTLLSLLVFSCKTREDIAREQMVENMNVRLSDQSKLSADANDRLQNLEDRLAKLNGSLEEQGHATETKLSEKTKNFEERLRIIEENNNLNREKIEDIQNTLKAQEDYLKSVVKSLEQLTGTTGKVTSRKNGKKESLYDEAMENYKKGHYKNAKDQFLTLIDKKQVKGSRRARVLHNLGMIEFIGKNDEKALFYFSRLYTDYPQAGYNKNGLLFLAKTFNRMGQKDEAVSTLNELIAKFPKASQVKEAKKLLTNLQ